MIRLHRRPKARVVARNVDLVIHESGMPAVQTRRLNRRQFDAITEWIELVRKDGLPHVIQSTEVNEREGIVPLPGEDHHE